MGGNDCCCGRYNAAEGTKIIGITSAAISVLAIIGFLWRLVEQLQAESQISELIKFSDSLNRQLNPNEPSLQVELEKRRNTLGALIGISIVCLLVAIALIFAAKKNNRHLALPYMIWTILCTIGAGIFGACLIFFVAVAQWTPDNTNDLIQFLVVPLIFTVIIFVLYTWWLVVVFNFYNRLKNGQAFDSIPMQTA